MAFIWYISALFLLLAHSAPTTLNFNDYYLTIQENGQTPITFGKNPNNSNSVLSFSKIAEYSTENHTFIPGSIVPLGGAWTVSNITRITDRVTFEMTFSQVPYVSLLFAVFWNNLTRQANYSMCSPDGLGDFCFKFDVRVPDYQWRGINGSSKLVLIFNLNGSVPEPTPVKVGYTVNVGSTFFQIVPGAMAKNPNNSLSQSVNASLEYMSIGNDSGIWIFYDNFPNNWTLWHDPSVGMYQVVPPKPDKPISTTIVIALVVSAVVIIVIVVAGVFYINHQKQAGYESVSG